MKREDYERLKEDEKAHLREVRKLKKRLREAERTRSIGKALTDMKSAGSTEDFDDALAKVQLEALEQEARLDVVLESAEEAGVKPAAGSDETAADEDSDIASEADALKLKDDLAKEKAAELVRHMKLSMGMVDTPPQDEGKPKSVSKSTGASEKRSPKTKGDTKKTSPEPEEESDVSKTIGRMKPDTE